MIPALFAALAVGAVVMAGLVAGLVAALFAWSALTYGVAAALLFVRGIYT